MNKLIVLFDLNDKSFTVTDEYTFITLDLYKAITQQMRELGWVE